jgi:hypothetical protein
MHRAELGMKVDVFDVLHGFDPNREHTTHQMERHMPIPAAVITVDVRSNSSNQS